MFFRVRDCSGVFRYFRKVTVACPGIRKGGGGGLKSEIFFFFFFLPFNNILRWDGPLCQLMQKVADKITFPTKK